MDGGLPLGRVTGRGPVLLLCDRRCIVPSGNLVNTLTGHEADKYGYKWVRSVHFSPDGHRIASGGVDGTVRIWDSSGGILWCRAHRAQGGGAMAAPQCTSAVWTLMSEGGCVGVKAVKVRAGVCSDTLCGCVLVRCAFCGFGPHSVPPTNCGARAHPFAPPPPPALPALRLRRPPLHPPPPSPFSVVVSTLQTPLYWDGLCVQHLRRRRGPPPSLGTQSSEAGIEGGIGRALVALP